LWQVGMGRVVIVGGNSADKVAAEVAFGLIREKSAFNVKKMMKGGPHYQTGEKENMNRRQLLRSRSSAIEVTEYALFMKY
jgi:hypothetical protein